MIRPEQIPDEVVEMLSSDTGMNAASMRYSLAAALAEWPGVHTKIYTVGKDHLILPLTQEPRT
jgi:hypothetical protein